MITCEINTGTSFVNVDQITGYIVPPDKPDELATAMRLLMRDKLDPMRWALRRGAFSIAFPDERHLQDA